MKIYMHWRLRSCIKIMGESSKFLKSWTYETQIYKTCSMPTKYSSGIIEHEITILSLNGQLSLDRLHMNRKIYYNSSNSPFWGWLSMESQPQNPEFRNNPENFHPCIKKQVIWAIVAGIESKIQNPKINLLIGKNFLAPIMTHLYSLRLLHNPLSK